jgi:hypothetical protein
MPNSVVSHSSITGTTDKVRQEKAIADALLKKEKQN